MVPPEQIDAVVFDMGGVFTIQNPTMIGATLAEAGIDASLDGAAARRGHYHGVRAWSEALDEMAPDHEQSEARERWWRIFDHGYFRGVGLIGAALDRAVQARLVTRPHDDVTHLWSHPLLDNIEGFHRIAALRPVAIVTNNVGTAVEQCAAIELCQEGPGPCTEVVAIVDSTVVGIAKPDPAIFDHALGPLGTDPARTVYVGDTVHADVRGAAAAGMVPLQLDPFDLHDDHHHWRLPGLGELADHLT